MISTLSHSPQVNSSREFITPWLVLAKRSSRCFWCWLSCFRGVEIAGGLIDVVLAQMTPMQPVDWLSNDWAIMFGR